MQKAIVAFFLSIACIVIHAADAADSVANVSISGKPKEVDAQPRVNINSGTCVAWKTHVVRNQKSFGELVKLSTSDVPDKGMAFTKNQLIVLLGNNLAAARSALASNKNRLEKTSEGLVDLRYAALAGFDLSGLNLDNVDFREADLRGANLSNSRLNYSIFYKSNLEEANLDFAAINFSNFTKANLVNAHLCEASLLYTDLGDAVFHGANMKGAKLDTAINIPRVFYVNAYSIFEIGLPVPPNYFDQ
jgi:hypothetical protein